DLNAFKSLKVGGAGNSLSLKKLKSHYAYKLDKVLSDGTAAAAKKKKGLTERSVARAYMLYVLGSFLFPTKKGIDVNDTGIYQRKPASVNEHGDIPVHQYEDIAEQYDASPQTSECDMLKETIEQMKVEIELKRVVGEQCALEFADLPRQLDAKCKEIESLKAVNTILMEQINIQLPPATPLVVLQSHQPVPDTTLAKKYEDLLAAHEDIKKKLIAKEDFRQKLVNTEEGMKSLEHKKLVNSEERKKTLEVDNNEWEVWRQALKKALASEGMGDMGDLTFKELFEQNERFFTITQQGQKGDYQEDLVSTAVTLENVVIARREKMAKKKKMQELLFQSWTKYLVDVRGVEISDINSSFRVTATIQHQSQHRFPDVIKSLKTFLCKDLAF
ncbi:hypothetical protein GIB67_034284, partial [Kingdonia uniflora]